MKKILIIAEKPSVAKSCAEYLEKMRMESGYYEGNRYTYSFRLQKNMATKPLKQLLQILPPKS